MKLKAFITKHKVFTWGLIIGIAVTSFGAILTGEMVERTASKDFCIKCHEMDVFCKTWEEGPHGPSKSGTMAADCLDCHLPHGNVTKYLYLKAKKAVNDVSLHIVGHEPDWIENLERRNKYTYESGCLKCHKELVAPEISLKAINAHRDYKTGETSKTCIDCHFESGHGDLEGKLKAKAKQEADKT